jgi:hypothetical protein
MAIRLLLIYRNVKERVLYLYIFVVKALDNSKVYYKDNSIYKAN